MEERESADAVPPPKNLPGSPHNVPTYIAVTCMFYWQRLSVLLFVVYLNFLHAWELLCVCVLSRAQDLERRPVQGNSKTIYVDMCGHTMQLVKTTMKETATCRGS